MRCGWGCNFVWAGVVLAHPKTYYMPSTGGQVCFGECFFFDLEPGHIGGLFKNGGTPKSMECSWDFLDWIFLWKISIHFLGYPHDYGIESPQIAIAAGKLLQPRYGIIDEVRGLGVGDRRVLDHPFGGWFWHVFAHSVFKYFSGTFLMKCQLWSCEVVKCI